jgi:DNA-binding CsgD family transcriptional regulator
LYESLPERQKQLLRLIGDGLSDADIASRLGEEEEAVGLEIRGVLTELGLRTRTHAIVYVLAREISARSAWADRGPDRPEGSGDAPAAALEDAQGTDEERPA